MAMIKELWAFLRTPEEILAVADLRDDGAARRADRAGPGLGRRAVHLHAVLKRARTLRILGISAFYHDSAAALIEDGRIVAAAQEERFSRKKHDARFPVHAIRYCLSRGRHRDWAASTTSCSTTSRS